MASALESRVLKVPKHPKMENIQRKLFEINIKLLGFFVLKKQNKLLELLCIYNYYFSEVKSLIEFIYL